MPDSPTREEQQQSPAHASPSGDLQADIVAALQAATRSLGLSIDGLEMTLRPIPLEGAWGFGSAVSFQLRRNGVTGTPQEIAERVAGAVPTLPQLERVEAVNGQPIVGAFGLGLALGGGRRLSLGDWRGAQNFAASPIVIVE